MVRMASIPYNCDAIILEFLRVYLVCSRTGFILAENDNEQTNRKTDLNGVGSVHHKQNNLPIHLQFLPIRRNLPLLPAALRAVSVAILRVQHNPTILRQTRFQILPDLLQLLLLDQLDANGKSITAYFLISRWTGDMDLWDDFYWTYYTFLEEV